MDIKQLYIIINCNNILYEANNRINLDHMWNFVIQQTARTELLRICK
jgi:hypothetical protein